MLGVNTSMRCSRMGAEGRVLSVIANELHVCTEQAVTAARAITSGLREAGAVVKNLELQLSSGDASAVAALEGEAATAIALVRGVIDRIRESVLSISTSGPQAIRLLQDAAQGVLERRQLSDEWCSARDELEQLVDRNADLADAAARATDMLGELRKQYTMQNERSIHDRLFPGNPEGRSGADRKPPNAAGADPELDELFL